MPVRRHGGGVEEFAEAYGHEPSRVLDFSVNTDAFLDLEPIRELIRGSVDSAFRYPEPTYARLREALARRHGVRPKNILPANGSAELLCLIARRFSSKKALIFTPAFSEYEAVCESESMEFVFERALEKDDFVFWRPDHIDAIGHFKPALVLIGNPNNPTGRLAAKDFLERLALACERHGVLLAVDEAFMDFAREEERRSLVRKAARSERVIVLRSLTKCFSIPGLRIGYAVGHPRTLESLAAFQPTWSVNALAQEVALRLAADSAQRQARLDRLGRVRWQFCDALRRIDGIKVYPSDVNFLLCRLDEKIFERERLKAFLGSRGMLIRFCDDFRGLENGLFIRLAVRSSEENAALAQTLQETLCHAG